MLSYDNYYAISARMSTVAQFSANEIKILYKVKSLIMLCSNKKNVLARSD